ncbi:MAG: hypothetical protein ACFFKA_04805, partial [Candidatus Thorarchaeota archaeon]
YTVILYEYISDTELQITKIFSESEGGNNFNTNLTEGLIINKINGVPINLSKGDTLGKALTSFDLNNLTLSMDTDNYNLNINITGVVIGIYTNSYFMYKNDVAKFFTSFWPEFVFRELLWLFVIAISITLFNMLPLPIFDGDRLIKELINWGFGEDYTSVRKKKEKFYYKQSEPECELSEYHVEKIDKIDILLSESSSSNSREIIELSSDSYELIDKTGDGLNDTVLIKLPDSTTIKEKTIFEVSYDYYHDNKKKAKMYTLNIIRILTLIILGGNFLLSFIKFGFNLFWL